LRTLAEGYDPVAGTYYGRSAADAPDIDGKVYFTSANKIAPGTFVDVKITEALDYDLSGEAVCSD
jgi:ribosomal protein S12 methylthiotransferase